MAVSLRKMRHLLLLTTLLSLIAHSLAAVDVSQRAAAESEALLVRKERDTGGLNMNFLSNILASLFGSILVLNPSDPSVSNSSTLLITDQFWLTFFSILNYFTFFCWFVVLLFGYVGGVLILFIFQIVGSTSRLAGNPTGVGTMSTGQQWGAFRAFDDENMPLFDKVTSVGYGLLDRTSELYNLAQTPECLRYAMCHLSSSLGDQEANGFVFKDLLRSISAQLDNKAGAEGMTRSVNVGLLTGECEEPIMSCPELAPYFKKVSETWANYL